MTLVCDFVLSVTDIVLDLDLKYSENGLHGNISLIQKIRMKMNANITTNELNIYNEQN
jgi:hypothetical protein